MQTMRRLLRWLGLMKPPALCEQLGLAARVSEETEEVIFPFLVDRVREFLASGGVFSLEDRRGWARAEHLAAARAGRILHIERTYDTAMAALGPAQAALLRSEIDGSAAVRRLRLHGVLERLVSSEPVERRAAWLAKAERLAKSSAAFLGVPRG